MLTSETTTLPSREVYRNTLNRQKTKQLDVLRKYPSIESVQIKQHHTYLFKHLKQIAQVCKVVLNYRTTLKIY